jgi:hypothetical protein
VYSWYNKLAGSSSGGGQQQQFPGEVRTCLARITTILAEKMAEVRLFSELF